MNSRAARCVVWWLLGGAAFAQGPARSVFVSFPKVRLMAGEQAQASAVARDAGGVARPGDVFTWRSSNPNILAVDTSGMVTARALGIADIIASTAGNIQGAVRLQVLPQRVEITPPAAVLFIGDTLQYSATAFDLHGEPIPGVNFQWQVSGANGNFTQAVAIDPGGFLTSRSTGVFAVRALIPYPGGFVAQFVNPFVAAVRLEVKARRDFRLSRLLSTGDVRHSFQLRAILGQISANDAGQVAFAGNLDGLALALLLYENGRFDNLLSAGVPGPVSGSFVNSIQDVVLNNRGQVLARVQVQCCGNGLVLASRAGVSYVALDGQSAAGVESIGGYQISASSLNDNGDIVFRAGFRLAGSTQQRSGLFRLPSGGLPQRVWMDGEPLPGLTGGGNVLSGIDGRGVVYFSAANASARGIFRQEGFSTPARMIGTGDALAGSTIQDIALCCNGGPLPIAASGDIAFFASLANGNHVLVRMAGAAVQTLPVRGPGNVYSVNGAGVLFGGDGGRGSGVYLWNQNTVTPVLLFGRLAPNNEPLQNVFQAHLSARGEVTASIRTALSEFTTVRVGAARPVLFELGNRVDVTANIHLYPSSLVGGSRAGSPHLILGNPSSLFRLEPRGLVPLVITGDRLPGGQPIFDVGSPVENSLGELYFAPNWKLTGDRFETIAPPSFRSEDGADVNLSRALAANDRGAVVWDANSNQRHNRLYLIEAGRPVLLATNAPGTPWETRLSSGGAVEGWGSIAIDEPGRVMADLRVRGGTSGLYLFSGGRWQQVAMFGRTEVAGLPGFPVVRSGRIKALGDRFYTVFGLRFQCCDFSLAEYRTDRWSSLIATGESLPTGTVMQGINDNDFDINRRGDILVAAQAQGGTVLILRSANGQRIVHHTAAPTGEGDYILDYRSLDLRDDGRVYFGGMDAQDRFVIYMAEPLFNPIVPPVRSRQRAP